MSEKLKRDQIAQFAQSCCISAGAGAGKTTCLVNAYLSLLRQGLPPQQIVVITFTEKAAAELAQRIEKAVKQQGDWELKLEQLQWAPITTIHSFCGRLLREHAAICGLDPSFSIMDASQFDAFLDNILQRLLRQWLKQDSPQLGSLLGHYSFSQLAPMLLNLLKASYVNALSPGDILRASFGAIVEKDASIMAAEAWAVAQALELEPYTQQCRDNLSQIAAADAGKTSKAARDRLQKAEDKLRAAENLEFYFERVRQAWQEGADPEQLHALLAQAKTRDTQNLIAPLLGWLQAWAMGLKEQQARRLTSALLHLFSEFYHLVEDELQRESALSFDHLIMKANSLFSQSFASTFHAAYPVVMVDEFQDVNPLQARLVRHMAGLRLDANGHIEGITSRLLLVGDRKQSIYGFRGADVSLLKEMSDKFKEFAHSDSFAITNNYRSPAELIDFFNHFFSQWVFAGNTGQGYAVNYALESDQQQAGKEHDFKGKIEILHSTSSAKKPKREDLRKIEATAIASHIKTIVNAGLAKYGDIVLLFRTLGKAAIYAQALEGIPHYIDHGGNFFQQSEVIDLALGLSSLEQPAATQNAIGACLSSLFGFDLNTLLLSLPVAALGQEEPAGLSAQQSLRWRTAARFYATYKQLAHCMQPAEVINALLQDTGWQLQLAALPDGAQKLANLRKLLEASRQAPWIHSSFTYLLSELDRAGKEPMAPLLGAQANVVRLMTVHQAKGLEFPVVFLPDLALAEPPSAPPQDFILGRQGELALNLGLQFNTEKKKTYTTLFQQLYSDYQARDAAEAARIFYVACTRAEQRLIFCYFDEKKTSRSQWSQWLQQLMQDQRMLAAHNIQVINSSSKLTNCPTLPAAESVADIEQQVRAVIKNCQPVRFKQNFIATSVSNLEEWLICPRRGWLRQNMGLDWARWGKGQGRAADPMAIRGWQFGNLVHHIMELIDFSKPAHELYNVLNKLNLPSSYLEPLYHLLAAFWATGMPETICAYQQVRREEPFAMCLHGNGLTMEISGEVDLLATSGPGQSLIVDYKVSLPKAEQYATQMKCYSLAWALHEQQIPQTVLCFLYNRKCQTIAQVYHQSDLERFQQEILLAGEAMVSAASVSDLARSDKCDPNCQLHPWCNR